MSCLALNDPTMRHKHAGVRGAKHVYGPKEKVMVNGKEVILDGKLSCIL